MTAAASKTFASAERHALCDLLDQVGPEAATLAGEWTTHDLAGYLWVRENDPVGSAGMVAKPLAGLLEKRLAAVLERWPYPELVGNLRTGPPRLSPYVIGAVDRAANNAEFFVRHEDVRRASEQPLAPRELDPSVEDWMWRRLKLLGKAWFKRAQVGVLLERDGGDTSSARPGQTTGPDSLRVVPGATIVTLIGKPSELLLFAYGRGRAAEVEVVGEPEAIEILYATPLGS